MDDFEFLNQSLPFKVYVARQSVEQISTFQSSDKGYYIPSYPLMILNFSFSDYKREFKGILESGDLSRNKLKDFPLYFSTVIHEIIHCYHIAGTTVGSLYYLSSWFQSLALEEFINDVEKNPNNYEVFKKFRYGFIQSVEYLHDWELWQNIKCLFGAGYDSKHFLPTIKDFTSSIAFSLENFFAIYKHHANKDIDFHDCISEILAGLIWQADDCIDYLVRPTDLVDSQNVFKRRNYFLHPVTLKLFTPTRSIIEGYARLCELDNIALTWARCRPIENIFNGIGKSEYLEIVKRKTQGIYGATVAILMKLLDHCDWEPFQKTALSIYELSLMTRFHPMLLFEGKKPALEELLVPFRFRALINYFVENKSSINDFCNPDENLIDGLDQVCDELGWMKYSDSLQKLLEFYRLEPWSERYEGFISRYIIQKKLNGDIFISDIYKAGTPPIIMMFDDTILYPDKRIFTNHDGVLNKLFLKAIYNFMRDIFSRELFFRSDFTYTKSNFRKYILDQDGNSGNAKRHFMKLRFSNFIKPEEMFS